jgi:hypothetical protein
VETLASQMQGMSSRCFVQYLRVSKKSPSNGYTLFLAAAEHRASASNDSREPVSANCQNFFHKSKLVTNLR